MVVLYQTQDVIFLENSRNIKVQVCFFP